MTDRPRLSPFPNRWYCVALSEEVKTGNLISRRFMVQDVVIFHTESAELSVMDAYCPHP